MSLRLVEIKKAIEPFFSNKRKKYTSFKGKIFATEPTIRIGEQMMKELHEMEKQSKVLRRSEEASSEKNEKTIGKISVCGKELYSEEDIKNCISKIKSVSFSETNVKNQIPSF